MRLKQLLTIFVFLVSLTSWSQEMSINGTVYDTTGQQPLNNAMVMAVRIKDSVLLGFTRTTPDGKFALNGFEIDTFSLIIDHPATDEKVYYMFGSEDNKEINIPTITMPSKSQQLDEVVIYAYKDPIYYKGDTLVYVADSFQVAEGAVVEDLLKKLPGITVDQDGKIVSQGQEISKVLVDGDEFFGSDPTIATKNLGADGIDEVQVYEAEDDEGIGGDGEKIQVLDLKLKEDAKKGYFGRISGASDFALTPINDEIGTNPFYEGELLLNKFNGAQKISVFALGSNTPRSNFGWGDMRKFGLDNETPSGNMWDRNSQGNTSGIPQTLMAGIYFSDKIGKKKNTKIGFNYSYYNNYLDATSASRSQYFLTDSTYYTDDSTQNITQNETHRFNFNLESKLDSLTTLTIKPQVSIDQESTEDLDVSDFFNSDLDRTIGTSVAYNTESQGYDVSGYARLNRKFMKKKRELEVRYDLSTGADETDGLLDSRTYYFLTTQSNDTTQQSRVNQSANQTHTGTATYIEPIGKKFKLEFEYLYQYGFNSQDRSTFDLNSVTNEYDLFNSFYSNIFDNTRQQHRGGVVLHYETSKHSFELGTRVRNIDIENVNKITDTTINQNISNVLPNFRYMFRPSMSKRIQVTYRTSSQQPSINDLQPVQDNSNPNRLQEGNPNLRPNYVHNLNINFNNWNALSGRFVYAGASLGLTQDAFSTETNYDQYGRTISRTINVDGNAFGFFWAGAGFPIMGRKIEFRPSVDGSYYRNVNYILSQENITNNYAINPGLDITFRFFNDSLEMGTEARIGFNNAISSLNNTATPFTTERYGARFKWKLPKGFSIGSEGTFTKNSQPGDGFYDTQFFVLNAELSKKFLKTQNLEIALVGNDILNQNVNARREINGNIITDYRTTIISRYFLLKATLRFNSRKTKEEDDNGWH